MLVLLLIPMAMAVSPDNIRIIQQQSAIVADSALTQGMNRCMLNHFCAVGVNELDGEVSDRSIASALLETYNVINTVLESESVSTELPNMRKIKSAFEVGQASKRLDLCNQVFTCAKTDIDLPLPSPRTSLGRSEVDCSDLAQVCPGVSVTVIIVILSNLSCLFSWLSAVTSAACSYPASALPPVPWPASSVEALVTFAPSPLERIPPPLLLMTLLMMTCLETWLPGPS